HRVRKPDGCARGERTGRIGFRLLDPRMIRAQAALGFCFSRGRMRDPSHTNPATAMASNTALPMMSTRGHDWIVRYGIAWHASVAPQQARNVCLSLHARRDVHHTNSTSASTAHAAPAANALVHGSIG